MNDGVPQNGTEQENEEDEIEPLRDALERAKLQAGKSAFKREALEAEVSSAHPKRFPLFL